MGLFEKLPSYGKWNVTNREKFSANELASVEKAEVVPSEFGLSVKINRIGGAYTFLPLSNTSKEVAVGDKVDLANCFMLTLSKSGANDIYKIEIQ